jgi:hypothetical protein
VPPARGQREATFYKWKARYGGLEVSDARRLRALEEENAKLKKLLAEAMLDSSSAGFAPHPVAASSLLGSNGRPTLPIRR